MFDKLDISQIIRYGYSGFLLTAAMSVLTPQTLKTAVEAAGSVVAPLTVFAVGAAIYVMYRYVIGEFVLFPLAHLIHAGHDRIFKYTESTSPIGFLRDGVRFGQRRAAYTTIRRHFFDDQQRERLDWNHSEVHVLYLTAVIAACVAVFVCMMKEPPANALAICALSGVLFWVAGLIRDISVHMSEGRLFKANKQEVLECLRQHGFEVRSDGGADGPRG